VRAGRACLHHAQRRVRGCRSRRGCLYRVRPYASWAEDDASVYWDNADLYERANGRLYISADFASPVGLDADDQSALASAFAHELTDEEQLPNTLAIHSGRDTDGNEHNPHAHLMISERQNDGIERDPDE
jgi:hypothetical protein